MLATLLCAGLMQSIPATKIQAMKPFTLLMFVSGKPDREYSKEESAEMLNGHLSNMERLYYADKAHAAGPIGGGERLRGILILDMPQEEIKKEMKNDPFVGAGLLDYELYTWHLAPDTFLHPKKPEDGIVEYVLVILTKGETWSEDQGAKLQAGHLTHIDQLRKSGHVGASGPLQGINKDWRGLMIFFGKDKAAVEKLISNDPMIKAKHLKAQILQLWMGTGLLKKGSAGKSSH